MTDLHQLPWWTVQLEVEASEPLTEDQLMAVASEGGVSTGNPGGRTYGTTLTGYGEDALSAAQEAAGRVLRHAPGRVLQVEAMSCEAFDAREEEECGMVTPA